MLVIDPLLAADSAVTLAGGELGDAEDKWGAAAVARVNAKEATYLPFLLPPTFPIRCFLLLLLVSCWLIICGEPKDSPFSTH